METGRCDGEAVREGIWESLSLRLEDRLLLDEALTLARQEPEFYGGRQLTALDVRLLAFVIYSYAKGVCASEEIADLLRIYSQGELIITWERIRVLRKDCRSGIQEILSAILSRGRDWVDGPEEARRRMQEAAFLDSIMADN